MLCNSVKADKMMFSHSHVSLSLSFWKAKMFLRMISSLICLLAFSLLFSAVMIRQSIVCYLIVCTSIKYSIHTVYCTVHTQTHCVHINKTAEDVPSKLLMGWKKVELKSTVTRVSANALTININFINGNTSIKHILFTNLNI